MNALTILSSPAGTALRTIIIGGSPWFIAKDVCDALGLSNTSRALEAIPDQDKHYQSLGLPGRNPGLVNESGFYKLVLKSRKPEARKFQDWVTGVVLPSLRKHGVAVTQPVAQAVASGEMTGEELMARAVLAANDTIARLSGERDQATALASSPSGNNLTMSSRDIAGLTAKEHKNVCRDIRNMLDELGLDQLSFEHISPDAYGRMQPAFLLPKDLTITLVSGYSVVMRHRIVTRWQELEAQQAPAMRVPQNMAEALRLAADQFTGHIVSAIKALDAQPWSERV